MNAELVLFTLVWVLLLLLAGLIIVYVLKNRDKNDAEEQLDKRDEEWSEVVKAMTLPPIVVVQHMARAHTARFVDRIARTSPVSVVEAEDGQLLRKNQVVVAPGGVGLDFSGAGDAVRARHVDSMRPTASIDATFAAAARLSGVDVAGVLLTGMGADGADGLSALFSTDALTIAQDEATCAVFGMPRAAIERGAVRRVLPLSRIATALLLWSAQGANPGAAPDRSKPDR